MTTQPDSSSPSSPYDVFLSFRGEDTRTNFTDHLHEALVRKGIRTFIDGELVRGEEISPALVKAIEESRISVVVFSKNYASSRWCLDELVKILQCKESKQQIVLPFFYKVDPSDVRKQTNSYGDAFVHHERKFKDDKEKVLKWRRALTEAGNLSGWHFKEGEYEATFINNIIDEIISRVLRRTYWNVAKHPVGIQSCVRDVERHLDVGGNGRRMVGIWGTSGIGKTTIAKAMWNAIAHKFEGSCFLSNVRDNSMSDGDLIKLQEALLHQILGGEWKIRSVDEGIGVIKERLSHKKFLLILDDVNQLKQLDNLAGVGWFGEGSRVITTTQDRGLLERHGIDLIYEVQMLYDDRALELFSLNAFGKSEPPNDYLELTKRAIAYAQGIPLALTLLGSHLRNKDKDRWQDILDSYEGEPYTGIQKILRKSYDALEYSVQQVFLDIACFFKGEKKEYVLQIVSNSKNKVSRDCIEVLIEKAMITIDYGRIQMHDLLEKLGKDIVYDESPNDPGERSRLWSPEDVYSALTEKNRGTRKIKGIMLKFSKPDEIRLHSKCFVGMINLEIFINRNVFLSGDVEYLPNELRLIDWGDYGCRLQSLPSEFHQVHLADFNMHSVSIKRLGKFKNMLKLTSMDLSGCQFLEEIPDLSGIPNIKYLNLSWCTSLVKVDDSVGRLDKLVQLNLEGCVRLTRFATRLRLKSLETLDLRDCKRLEIFPKIEVEMESLRRLCMRGSGIKELPPSIVYLTGLQELDLRGCFNLTRIATLRLKSLEELDLRNCEGLERFLKIEFLKESPRELYMRGSGIRELHPSITSLTGPRVLDLRACFNRTRYVATFINNIVDGILNRVLRGTYSNVAQQPIGIQSHVHDVKKLLDVGGNGRRMVGIWGTSGIGKTTIAKAMWNAISHEFEGSCFLENVREGSLVQLQKTLIHKYLGKKLKIQSVDEGIGVIKERLRHKKILLILDDVDRLEQLDKLAGDDCFGEGSRVIITTKNRRLLDNREIELIYQVKKLDYNQALELFSWHAFRRSEPPKDYLELAQRAIAFADGLPLALKILGSHLRGIDIRRWQYILDSYEGEPYTGIERILQKSFDALDDCAKEYFLDIACLFKGKCKDYVLQMVPPKFIEEFVDKALITIEGSEILMHNLLANLGKDIVYKESPDDPGLRSRLWFYEDVVQVLTENTGTRNIKGIMVKFPEPAEITLNPVCFRNMANLQIFIIHNASLRGNINYLPNALRIIDWPSCQLQSLPPNFQGNRLVEFNMPSSHIKQLEGFKHLPNLTYMNLSGCQFLEKIPDLSGIPNIEYLILSGCTRLVEVDESIGFLDKLVELDLGGCFNLTKFARRLRLKSLETLILWGCKRLESFPEIEVRMESLWGLYMQQSGIIEFPASIQYLTELRHLDLAGCFNLTEFPTLRLESLQVLDLKDCKRLESFPEFELLSTWSTLRELNLSGTNFVTLPECISKFVSLEVLFLRDCGSLLEIPQEVLPPRVGRVFLDNCTSLEKFPKLPLSSEVEDKELSLINCVRLRGYDITENIFLDQVSSPHSQFQITLPGDEVPKWFRCCKDVTLVERSFGCNGRCEVCFEIPPNLDWETLRLVLCVVNKGNAYVHLGGAETRVHINRKMVQSTFVEATETHVSLNCIPLLNPSELGVGEELTQLQKGNMCQIIFEFYDMPTPVKILCGVHLLGHQVADHGPT